MGETTVILGNYSRISCSVMFRIRNDKGQIVLHRARKGDRTIMRPIGGALQASSPRTITQLRRRFGARGFEGGLELRFLLPTDEIGAVEEWFKSGQGRERNPRSALGRQMSRDLRVVTHTEATHLQPKFAYHTRHSGESANPTAMLKLTQYLIEVYDVQVPDHVMAKLVQASEGPVAQRRLYFTTRDEIKSQSGPGGYVSSLALTLLR